MICNETESGLYKISIEYEYHAFQRQQTMFTSIVPGNAVLYIGGTYQSQLIGNQVLYRVIACYII